MKNINILIIEDTPKEGARLKKHLEKMEFNVVAIATNLEEAIVLYFTKEIDLVIIDVFLDGNPDGILFAEKINAQTKDIKPFVFLTSHMDRGLFERARITQPYSFLLKPFKKHEIIYTIELALENYMNNKEINENESFSFFVKKGTLFFKVSPNDLLYIEVEGRYSKIVTKDNCFLIQSSLSDLHIKLSITQFLRTHRNYVVNRKEIKEVHPNDNLIILSNDSKVLLGRSYKEAFFNEYKVIK